ncbi:DUF4132 domain-containing protein [Streptomyces sp. NPDC006460]|uniref:DUF4132 domain-containing protein n=1 Tax=Streptomyces sp. NPDC006460 TaxID=3154304 RepID=UPI0033A139F7
MVGTTGLANRLDEAVRDGRAGELVDSLDAAGRRECALLLQARICRRGDRDAAAVLTELAGQRLGWSTAESDVLLARLVGPDAAVAPHELREGFLALVPIALSAAEQSEEPDRARLRALHRCATDLVTYQGDAHRPVRDRLAALLAREVPLVDGRLPRHLLDSLDAFGPAMRSAHADLLDGEGVAAFLGHCVLMDRPRATRAWRRTAAVLLARTESGPELVRRLLAGIAVQPEHRVSDLNPWGMSLTGIAGDTNTCLVRGLLWAALDADADRAVPLAGAIALHAGTGIGGSGSMCRNQPLATTAVAVLGACEGRAGEQAVQWLGRLPKQVRNRTVLKGIATALEAVAARSGLTPSMLRERGVPTHGLDGRGMREEQLGAYTAVLSVREPGTAVLSFLGPGGRVLKSPPRTVRDEHGERLAPLRAALKGLRAELTAERTRLEEHLAAGTTWSAEDWERYCVDHPVTGAVARALLWEVAADGEPWSAGLVERTGGGWALAGAGGTATPVGPGSRLRLWHPVRAAGEDVSEWRDELTGRELRQPFKQVFREVYPLTPAEVATGAYSNRFAGHVLRYGQARALMTERGWRGNHLGYFGEGYSSEMVRELPRPGGLPAAEGAHWRARFSVELVDEGARGDGVARLCSTDQVRFERRAAAGRGAWERAALPDVPRLVLSEALRDVDLFTAVASIGADPRWRDRGEERAYDGYWESWSFGELTESARIRRETLARLLPRTRIADRVELTDRFLRVRGELRAYRIHLGSGNVLMEPEDAYLCIVADRGAAGGHDEVFLPFEEDGGLLSVILSKAFLLAADTGITDRTITDQIRRGL